jgi:hypothetical protein
MGSGTSIALSYPVKDHEDLYKRTEQYRTLISDIFNYMLYQLDVNDFLQLSSQAGCKKYVLFMANNLQYFFHQMRVDVSSDKHGILAFQKSSVLESPSGDAALEKQTLCLALSYYYTRIFQIYAALAITLMDDISALEKTSTDVKRTLIGTTQYIMNPPPGHKREVLTVSAEKMKQFGGFAGMDMGNFEFMSSFLTDNRQDKGFVSKYRTGDTKTDAVIFFKPTTDQWGRVRDIRNTPQSKSLYETAIFNILIESVSSLYSTLEIRANKIDGAENKIRFGISKLSFRKKGMTYDTSIFNIQSLPEIGDNISTSFTVIVSSEADSSKKYAIENSDESIEKYFNRLFLKLVPALKRQISDKTEYSSESKDPDELQTGYLKYTMENRPIGHCIARGMQILSSLQQDSFGKPFFTSSVCKVKFFKSAKSVDGERKGLPEAGKSIAESTPFKTALYFFADTIAFGSPKLLHSPESIQIYKASYLKMLSLMEGPAKVQEVGEKVVSSSNPMKDYPFSEIKNKRDMKTGYCRDYMDTDIKLDETQGRAIKNDYVLKLFEKQFKHAEECGKIFAQLFYHKRTGNHVEIALSENIQRGGIPEINRINAIVRALLLDYYVGCEEIYHDGMRAVIQFADGNKKAEVQGQQLAQQEQQLKAQQAIGTRGVQPLVEQKQVAAAQNRANAAQQTQAVAMRQPPLRNAQARVQEQRGQTRRAIGVKGGTRKALRK